MLSLKPKAVLEMEMPDNCAKCLMRNYDHENGIYFCHALFRISIDKEGRCKSGRSEFCPLKPGVR